MTGLNRHRNILEFALASLLRRRGKTLSVIAVYAFTIFVLSSVIFLTQSLRTEAVRVLAGTPELVVQRMMAGRHDMIPVSYAEKIRTIPGVGEVKPRYWGYYYDVLTKANYSLVAWDGKADALTMLRGRMPTREGECAVGSGVASALFADIDGDLALIDSANIGRFFRIVGVFAAESALLTNDLVVLEQGDLVTFFGFPEDRATDLSVEVYNPAEIPTVAAKIRMLFSETRPITRPEILRTYDAVFDWRSGMMLTIFLSALVTFSILAWDKATGISAEEKREVGILKALGWDTTDVLTLKIWEGAVISLTAFLVGTIAAYLHVFFFGASLLAPVLKGWSVLFPAFRPVPSVDLYQIFVIGFLTVVPYIASTVIPSWKTAVTDPDSVMRS